jgi:hypothetical protein
MIGGELRNMAAELKQVNPEMAKTLEGTATGIDSLTGALGGAAQGFAVGGPFGAAVGGLIGLMTGPLKSAYTDMQNSFVEAELAKGREKESYIALGNAIAAHAARVRQEGLDKWYQAQRDAINEAAEAMVRYNKILDAKQAAQGAATERDIAASGAPPAEQAAARALAAFDTRVADIQQTLKGLEEAAANAETLRVNRDQEYKQEIEYGTKTQEELNKLAGDLQAAEKAAKSAALDLKAGQEIADQQIAEASAKYEQSINSAAKTIGDDMAREAESVMRDMEALAKQRGQEISGTMKIAYDSLANLAQDGTISPDEVGRLKQAFDTARSSQEARDQSVFDGLTAQKEWNNKMAARMETLVGQMKDAISRIP